MHAASKFTSRINRIQRMPTIIAVNERMKRTDRNWNSKPRMRPHRAARRAAAVLFLAGLFLLSACRPDAPGPDVIFTTATPTAIPAAGTASAGTAAAASMAAATPTKPGNEIAVSSPLNSSDPDCTYSLYYWETNPDRWLTDNIVIGRFTYTKGDALAVFSSASTDSTTIILKQFFGAALNILKGADPSAIESEMAHASEWIDTHPPGVDLSAADRQQANDLALKLQAFNGGEIGPGRCPDEPSTPTPTPTLTPTVTLTPTRPTARPTETATPSPDGQTRPGPGPAPTAAPGATQPPPTATDRPAPSQTQPPATERPTPTSAPLELPTSPPIELPTSPALPQSEPAGTPPASPGGPTATP